MDAERNKEIQNEIGNSTFVEQNGEGISVELGAKAPESSVEQKGLKEQESGVKSDNVKKGQKLAVDEKKGLGYEPASEEESSSENPDYSSSYIWRKAWKEKRVA